MSAITEGLHSAFLRPLGSAVLRHSGLRTKPLCVDLALPHPPRLRVYMYSLVGGVGTVRPNEYKAVLRVRLAVVVGITYECATGGLKDPGDYNTLLERAADAVTNDETIPKRSQLAVSG